MSIERKSSERNNVRHRSRKRETTKENKFGHDNWPDFYQNDNRISFVLKEFQASQITYEWESKDNTP